MTKWTLPKTAKVSAAAEKSEKNIEISESIIGVAERKTRVSIRITIIIEIIEIILISSEAEFELLWLWKVPPETTQRVPVSAFILPHIS